MKKLKNMLAALSKNNLFLRKFIRRGTFLFRKWRYRLRALGKKTQEKTVVFSCFYGKKYADSPKAIYEYMCRSDDYRDWTFIWIFEKPEQYAFLLENPNTKIVKYATKECDLAFATARYWVCNHRAALHRFPTKKQVFIQTWHGTPLKRLGFDIEVTNNENYTLKEQNDQYLTDAKKFTWLLSPSAFASEKFISAFALKRLGKEKMVVEEGYPRNDFLLNYTTDDVRRVKAALGLPDDKKVILYAPTWRDNQHDSKLGYTYRTAVDFDALQTELGGEYVILFRAHYFIANAFDFEKYSGFVYNVSELDDINDLYIVADMLITDYSSVFFDYAILKRPILYYMYDYDLYKNEMRGFYIDLAELPGPIVKAESDLVPTIRDLQVHFTYDETYRRFHDKFNYLDDGHAAERVARRLIK